MEKIWNPSPAFMDEKSKRAIPKGFSKQPQKIAERLISEKKVNRYPPPEKKVKVETATSSDITESFDKKEDKKTSLKKKEG